jgi:hypothetical protein
MKFNRADSEYLTIEVKVKMVKICHKDILTLRYFFLEILSDIRKEL